MAYAPAHPVAGVVVERPARAGFWKRLLVAMVRARELSARRQLALHMTPELAEAILTRQPMTALELEQWFAGRQD